MYSQAVPSIRAARQWPPRQDHDGKWKGELPGAPDSPGSFVLFNGTFMWPSIWRLAPDILSSKSLDLVAIDMIVVAVN